MRLIPSCLTLSITSHKQMRKSSTVALSIIVLGANSILLLQRMVKPACYKDTSLSCNFLKAYGEFRGNTVACSPCFYPFSTSTNPLLCTAEGNTKLNRLFICSGMAVMFNFTQLKELLRRDFAFLSFIFSNSEDHQNSHIS